MRNLVSLGSVFALAFAAPAFAQDAPVAEAAAPAAEAAAPAPEAAAPAAEAAAPVAANVEAKRGEAIYTADGKRVGKIYQISREGNPQLIQDLRLVTVPAATLSRVDGKLTTSLTRKEIK